MAIIRSPRQVALQELVTALRETIDLLRDAADYLHDSALSPSLENLAGEREAFIAALDTLIRAEHDLPTVPDEDRETGQKLFSHLRARLAADTTAEILLDRIHGEDTLIQAINQCHNAGIGADAGELLAGLERHVAHSRLWLQNQLELRRIDING